MAVTAVASIEVPEEPLEEFVGTLFVVCHDRYFLDQTVDHILELRDGQFTEFVGGYTDYFMQALTTPQALLGCGG